MDKQTIIQIERIKDRQKELDEIKQRELKRLDDKKKAELRWNFVYEFMKGKGHYERDLVNSNSREYWIDLPNDDFELTIEDMKILIKKNVIPLANCDCGDYRRGKSERLSICFTFECDV